MEKFKNAYADCRSFPGRKYPALSIIFSATKLSETSRWFCGRLRFLFLFKRQWKHRGCKPWLRFVSCPSIRLVLSVWQVFSGSPPGDSARPLTTSQRSWAGLHGPQSPRSPVVWGWGEGGGRAGLGVGEGDSETVKIGVYRNIFKAVLATAFSLNSFKNNVNEILATWLVIWKVY